MLEYKNRVTVAHLEASEVQGHPPEYRTAYLMTQAAGVGFEEYMAEDGHQWGGDLTAFTLWLYEGAADHEPSYDRAAGVCHYPLLHAFGGQTSVRLERDTIADVLDHGGSDPSSVSGMVNLMAARSDLTREHLLQMDYADWTLLRAARLGFTSPHTPAI